MTDQAGQVQEAAPQEAITQASPEVQPAQQEAVWTDGFSDATLAFATGKSWSNPEAVVNSYQNLEKLAHGSKDVIAKPNYENVDEVNTFYNELGRPSESKDYKFEVPDHSNDNFVDWYRGSAHETGLTQTQAEKLFGAYMEYEGQFMEQHNQETESNRLAEVESLKKELGAGVTKELEICKRGWKQMGCDQEDINFMEDALGPQLAFKIGSEFAKAKGTMESDFVDGDPNGVGFGMGMTPEAAKQRIAQKLSDPAFKKAYMTDKGLAHDQAVKEMERLNAYVEGLQPN